jgi:hypothetical protein
MNVNVGFVLIRARARARARRLSHKPILAPTQNVPWIKLIQARIIRARAGARTRARIKMLILRLDPKYPAIFFFEGL